MLEKLAAVEEAITIDEISSFENHLEGREISKYDAEFIASLGRKLGSTYEGPIYRGLYFSGEEEIKKFLSNMNFTAWGEGDTWVDSWSTKDSQAARFATSRFEDDEEFGVLLESHTSEHEVLIYFDERVFQALMESGFSDSDFVQGVGAKFLPESEVIVRPTPNKTYNLCAGEVLDLYVNPTAVYEWNDEGVELIREHLSEGDVQEFDAIMGAVRAYAGRYLIFACGDDGGLALVGEDQY